MHSMVSLAERLARPARVLWRRTEALRDGALRLLYPPRCVLCDGDVPPESTAPVLCPNCLDAVIPAEWVGCCRCAHPVASVGTANGACSRCRGLRYHFDAAVAFSSYQGRLKEAVLKMKWQSGEAIAEAMGTLLCQQRGDRIRDLGADLVAPIPMHWRRRWSRRTNSPDILAANVARYLQVPYWPGLLKLSRNIKPQKELGIRERRKNLAGAFRAGKGYDIKGTRVLLVDDVLTTGATCDVAAQTLRTSGAGSVVVVVLARTVAQV